MLGQVSVAGSVSDTHSVTARIVRHSWPQLPRRRPSAMTRAASDPTPRKGRKGRGFRV